MLFAFKNQSSIGCARPILPPVKGAKPAKMALDETVIWIERQQYWLYTAVGSATNRFLHVRLYSARTTGLIEIFLAELMEKHDVEGPVFQIDSVAWLKAARHRRGLEFLYDHHGDRNTVKRAYREIKRHTYLFSNPFSHVYPEPIDS